MFSYVYGDYAAYHTRDRAEYAIVEKRQTELEIIVERREYDERKPYENEARNEASEPAVLGLFERNQTAYEYGYAFYYLVDDRYSLVRRRKKLNGKRRNEYRHQCNNKSYYVCFYNFEYVSSVALDSNPCFPFTHKITSTHYNSMRRLVYIFVLNTLLFLGGFSGRSLFGAAR